TPACTRRIGPTPGTCRTFPKGSCRCPGGSGRRPNSNCRRTCRTGSCRPFRCCRKRAICIKKSVSGVHA
ncbi:unnamed protein product, partial [Nesidiocoris tenuis]